jgi:hypothetical protein
MDPPVHKFKNKVPVSYEELVKDPIEEKLQLAKEFEARFGRSEVLGMIEGMSVRNAVARARKRVTEANIRSLEDYARWLEKMHDNETTRNTQTFEIIEVSEERFHFKVHECLWAKAYRDLGMPEYGYAFECCTDFPACQVMNPAMRLRRDRTLMMGDDCCDFVYTWEDAPKGQPTGSEK